jgi:hypothetical protein
MTGLYGPILTGVGLLKDGKLTTAAKASYVAEVLGLLATGNDKGMGGTPQTQIFNHLVPLPPISGPVIPNVTTLESEPLFWFKPDPIAALMATQLIDPKKTPIWNAIFPDLIYEKTAIALDLPGNTPLFPIFDVSAAFGVDLPLPFALPDLAAKLNILPLPKLLLKLADLNIAVSIPTIPLPPLPPKLPAINLSIPPLILLDFCIGLIKLPFTLLLKLLLPPDLGLILKLIALDFSAVLKLALDIVIQLLVDLGLLLIVPKLLVASILIYVKDVVAMVCTDIVGSIVGAGGSFTKLVATGTGLIGGSEPS